MIIMKNILTNWSTKKKELLDGKLKCSHCKEWKQLDSFGNCKCKTYGKRSTCKECIRAKNREEPTKLLRMYRSREKYQRNKDVAKKKGHERYIKNKDKRLLKSRQVYAVSQFKHYAKQLVRVNVKRGIIKKRNICEVCLRTGTIFHHHDYSKPLDVIEMCQSCHMRLHIFLKNKAMGINRFSII